MNADSASTAGAAGQKAAYRRVLLKLSGEALMGNDSYGINRQTIEQMCQQVADVNRLGVELAIVIGGGNIFRGVSSGAAGMDRATADYMGMLATVMNALALQDALRQMGVNARVQSALEINQIVEPYIRPKALRYLEEVDGVYTADPVKDPSATRYREITFDEAIHKNLKVMDTAAFALCRDQKLPLQVFSIFKPGALTRVVCGEDEGTLVHV